MTISLPDKTGPDCPPPIDDRKVFIALTIITALTVAVGFFVLAAIDKFA